MSILRVTFSLRQINVTYLSVSFHCDSKVLIHKVLCRVGCVCYSSKTSRNSKYKLLPCSLTSFPAKSFVDSYSCSRYLSVSSKDSHDSSKGENVQLSQRQKLKRAIRDYGAVVIVFHIGISLLSLAGFYLAVANGFDIVSLLQKTGLSSDIMNNKFFLEGGTFVIAYGIHKLFAPARIAITLSTTPFIVRYLRKIQILKMPKSK